MGKKSKLDKNKQLLIFGRAIYTSHIEKILLPEFIYDSVLDTYIPILIFEENNYNQVTIFSVVSIISNYTSPTFFSDALRAFLRHKIGDYDILMFPITYASHCFLYVVFKKFKIILYLDSLKITHTSQLHLIRL